MEENYSKKERGKIFIKNIAFFLVDILANAIFITSIVFLIKTYIVAPFEVYGPSMCDTLNYYDSSCKQGPGEYILVNKLSYHKLPFRDDYKPERGDIVIFKEPINKKDYYIKRIIGLPGDTVIIEDGFVYIKNKDLQTAILLDETSYLNDLNFGNTKYFRDDLKEFVVPEGGYFVLGDNRTASSDSRRLFSDINQTDKSKAFITEDIIIGKAWLAIWPLKNIRFLEDIDYGELNEE